LTRRLTLVWPDARPFAGRGRPIRILALSDEVDPTLASHAVNHTLGPIDAIVACGDLEPDYLAFVADAFVSTLLLVLGNHDRGVRWQAGASALPDAIDPISAPRIAGIPVAGLSWPRRSDRSTDRSELGAWTQATRVIIGGAARSGRPMIVVSHAPPRGLGDDLADPFHRGFRAYRWLLARLPVGLWLHGHTTPAASQGWRLEHDGTPIVNVTGSVLIELVPPARPP